jgi:divalent metal cation (Fe/Co/Zn/Cd) transporter
VNLPYRTRCHGADRGGAAAVSGSVALLGGTLHNAADALTAVPLGIAFIVGRRPPTRRYTDEYGRAEDLAGVVIVLIIAAFLALAAQEAPTQLAHPARAVGAGLVRLVRRSPGTQPEQHYCWISQFPHEQETAIRTAENAATWGLTTAAAVALHEHHKRTGGRLSASVTGTGPPPGKMQPPSGKPGRPSSTQAFANI